MRILHVNSEKGFSGGEIQVMLLLRGLRDHGIENILCAASDSQIAQRATKEGFETCSLSLNNDADLPGLFKLIRIIKQYNVDVVHLHTGRAIWLGSLAAYLMGIPAIATKRMDRPIKKRLKSRLIWGRFLQAAVGISQQVVEQMLLGGVPKERCHLIYSTVDPDVVKTDATREGVRSEWGLEEDELLLLSLGSLNHRKGFDILIDALVHLRALNLQPTVWIAGEGPEERALKAYAAQAGVEGQICWLGQRSDAADLLKAADVVAMPSRAEGLGIACLEAMAAGCPVVASRVGGLQETIVNGESGFLVPAEDSEALADAIKRLLEDQALREAMHQSGPARVQAVFAPEKMVIAYEALYKQICGKSS